MHRSHVGHEAPGLIEKPKGATYKSKPVYVWMNLKIVWTNVGYRTKMFPVILFPGMGLRRKLNSRLQLAPSIIFKTWSEILFWLCFQSYTEQRGWCRCLIVNEISILYSTEGGILYIVHTVIIMSLYISLVFNSSIPLSPHVHK